MILSHRYRFIFIKTSKTAGTSVEIALSTFCGPSDIITPVSEDDERVRESLGGRKPQNFLAPPWEYGWADVKSLLLNRTAKRKYFNHMSAELIRDRVGSRIWNSYFKFCVERNPWDRVISQYYYRYRKGTRPPIGEYLRSNLPIRLKRRGSDAYRINGSIAVDRICRFESLTEDLEEVRRRVGIPDPLVLPKAKSQFRTDRRSYRDVLGTEERQIVAELFEDEIQDLGYEF